MVGTHGGAAMTSRDVGLGLRVLILNLGRSLGTGFRITIAVESAPAGSSSGSMDTAKVGVEANLPLTATNFLPAQICLFYESSIPRVRRTATSNEGRR